MARADAARRESSDAIQGRPSPLAAAPARRRRGRFRKAVPAAPPRDRAARYVWGLVLILGLGIVSLVGLEMSRRLGEGLAARSAGGTGPAGLSLMAPWPNVTADGRGAEDGEPRGEKGDPVQGSLRLLEDRVRALEKDQAQRRMRVEFPRD